MSRIDKQLARLERNVGPSDLMVNSSDTQTQRMEPYRNLHRALRGKYWLACLLALVGGSIGGWYGYHSQLPTYRSEGLLRIAYALPAVKSETRENGPMGMYEEFMQSQALSVTSRRVLSLAMKNPVWQQVGEGISMSEFVDALFVEHPSRTETLRITYADRDPAVSAAAVRSVIEAYSAVYSQDEGKGDSQRMGVLTGLLSSLQAKLESTKAQIRKIAHESGTDDFEELYKAKLEEVNKMEARLTEVQIALSLSERKENGSDVTAGLTIDQIAVVDQHMRELVSEREKLESELDRMKRAQLDLHPDVVKFKALLEAKNERIRQYAEQYRKFQITMQRNSAAGTGTQTIVPVFASAEALRDEEASLTKLYDQAHEGLVALGQKRLEIQELQEKIKQINEDMKSTRDRIESLTVEGAIGGRLQVISPGEVPSTPFKDRRKPMAAVGGLGGAFIPVLGLALFFMMNRRYQHLDDSDPDIANTPLLGILPALPEDLSDPEQAAIAAHCIHQIRVMLQLGSQGARRNTYMVTSSASGDGKSSIAMALGLSFAAAGSRTLVMDCDLTGQGISSRLKANPGSGVVEALSSGNPYDGIVKTQTANLSVLTAGSAEGFHANMLSPTSVHNLIEEVRKGFDAILIDTGPILGSLEASVIASEVDAVILTVSRGQQQPLVQRSIKRLRAVGANMAGIIFNRAKTRDFNRSYASQSVRSMSSMPSQPRALIAESDEPSRFGPLARAVASFLPTIGSNKP